MDHSFVSRGVFPTFAFVLSAVMLISAAARAEEYPIFDQKYWEAEQGKAHGKIMRGAVLGVTGLAISAPTAVLAIKAADNPEQYLAYSIACGIAGLGMTMHGFFSIAFGAKQQDKSTYFVDLYKKNSPAVQKDEERDYYLRTQKKSTGKMMLFGMVLAVQGAGLLANGIVLSVRKSNDDLTGGVAIWPSYLIGGILFAGGTSFIILRARRYLALDDLGRVPPPAAAVSLAPLLSVDPATGNVQAGLLGRIAF